MKLNNLYDIIADGWRYTIILKIKDTNGRCYSADFCRGLRKGDENKDYVSFLKSLDFNVARIYCGSDDAGVLMETEPVYIRKS